MDNETILFDRIEVIKTTNDKWDLLNNAYLSFSGGKDSTILHHLLDEALPNNRIPRVYFDTGIEYKAIRDFVMGLAEKDDRFEIVKPTLPIKATLEKYGYPFKSKEHSQKLRLWRNGSRNCKFVETYLHKNDRYACPQILRYQFEDDSPFKVNVSPLCCQKMKKEPAHKYERKSGRKIAITGMRKQEGGERTTLGCILTDKSGNLKRFHPLAPVTEDFIDWYRERERIELAVLYEAPYFFKRTGCKFCPYSLDLERQLEVAYRLMPEEALQGEMIWKPIFDEYRRIGFRLKKTMQIKLDL